MKNTRYSGLTLVELLVAITVITVAVILIAIPSRIAYRAASLASSANNIRQIAAGAASYLGDHNNRYWKFREDQPNGDTIWWYGYETKASQAAGEGNREFDPAKGPLGGYIPAGLNPDPSFALLGKPFKPKYQFGYIGIGYNVHLAANDGSREDRWSGGGTPVNQLSVERPGEIVVFATSAQVNTFQPPASRKNPMVEEFYGLSQYDFTVHFRHNGKAMVVFANGSVGFLEIDPSTLDPRDPDALVGRFAPYGDTKYLVP